MRKTYKAVKRHGKKHDEHRLVMEKVLGRKLSCKEVVHHKDGNIHNNDPDNLEVMSLAEHARYHGRQRPNGAKLNPIKVRAIRKLIKAGISRPEIAKQFSVSIRAIEDIDWGATWGWVE